ncbi:MAG: CapA family protein [Deltaproteobacteria bacterium]|nr:CapA family protein [Deltaproteobacteria bacterium]
MVRPLLVVVLLAACEAPPAPEPVPPPRVPAVAPSPSAPEPPAHLYVVLGGDLMLQDQIHDVAKERGSGDLAAGYAWLLHALRLLLSDLRSRGEVRFVVNLESPVAAERYEPRSFPPRFNGPPEALVGIARAGVTDVTLANNHALDQGRSGLAETIENARAAGLGTAGAGGGVEARAPLVLGTSPSAALLAYYLRPGGRAEPSEGAVMAVLDERSLAEVRDARSLADAVIVTIHWVGEFKQAPRDDLVRWAEDLVLAGADAVVCHGPHVLGPSSIVETPDGRQALVAYSLGNLVSNMGWEVYPTKPLEPGKDSAQRVEAREQTLAVLEISKPANAQSLTAVALVPMWLMDNRYAVYRKDAGPRLIYPLPLVNCTLPDPLPCFPASKPAECEALAATLETLVSRPAFEGFCPN